MDATIDLMRFHLARAHELAVEGRNERAHLAERERRECLHGPAEGAAERVVERAGAAREHEAGSVVHVGELAHGVERVPAGCDLAGHAVGGNLVEAVEHDQRRAAVQRRRQDVVDVLHVVAQHDGTQRREHRARIVRVGLRDSAGQLAQRQHDGQAPLRLRPAGELGFGRRVIEAPPRQHPRQMPHEGGLAAAGIAEENQLGVIGDQLGGEGGTHARDVRGAPV
ncbi:MAG: hypothetical protein DYG90_00830 [Chloroflexi bacterium CFX6]|nr:hypothetical protein [Chloroflexi bacterium CFX6]